MDRTPLSVTLEVLFSRHLGQRQRALSLVGVAFRPSDECFVNADLHLLPGGTCATEDLALACLMSLGLRRRQFVPDCALCPDRTTCLRSAASADTSLSGVLLF